MIRSLCAAVLIAASAAFALPCAAADALDFSTIRRLAVQDGGRLKPLDTFAREHLRFIHGRERFAGQDPIETLLSIAFETERWADEPLLDVPYVPLFEALGLPKEKRRLSPAEYGRYVVALRELERGSGILPGRPTRLAEAARELAARADALRGFAEFGRTVAVVPAAPDDAGEEWTPLAAESAHGEDEIEAVRATFRSLSAPFVEADAPAFEQASRDLVAQLRALNPEAYPSERRMALECHYNAFKPFRAVWALYVGAFLLALVSLWSRRTALHVATLIVFGLGALVHTYGLVLRTAIAGRAPLTNMYESLVFMSWGIAALGLIFEGRYRMRYAVLVASALGVITITIAQRLTFDIRPAVAVLRSVWLSYHVLTVMLGYSAFAVALGAGHLVLGRHALSPARSLPPGPLDDFVYRTLQVGVLFLAAGIITGSVWANYSWGRYWGWDPKETWSLITLLGYLAVLHARSQRWLGAFGMGVASILCFLLVVMTYYGVNYILRGLHSYAGDDPTHIPLWLIAYVVFELLFVGAAALIVHMRAPAQDQA